MSADRLSADMSVRPVDRQLLVILEHYCTSLTLSHTLSLSLNRSVDPIDRSALYVRILEHTGCRSTCRTSKILATGCAHPALGVLSQPELGVHTQRCTVAQGRRKVAKKGKYKNAFKLILNA